MYFIGDTHGMKPVLELIAKHDLRDQNLIHVGDFGLGFVEISRDINNLLAVDEALVETNNKLYVIRGNHDNPVFWEGLNLPKLHNLILVPDYTLLPIEGKNILFIGGAISIDRYPRKQEYKYNKLHTYWKNEVFNYDDVKLSQAIGADNVDIVVTHTAPSVAFPRGVDASIVNHYHDIESYQGNDLKSELLTERAEVQMIYDELKYQYNIIPQKWIYGHFHNSKVEIIGETEFRLLDINELYELS